jgi:anti-sigma B factor antagonist
MLKVSSRIVDGVAIADLNGRITLGENSALLRETVRGLLGEGRKKILLNLAGVTHIDSCGLGELVSAYTSVRRQSGELKLLNLTAQVEGLLQITKLCTIFDTAEEERAAVASFGKA